MSFGAKLRELLAERDIRQKDFAQLLHVSPSNNGSVGHALENRRKARVYTAHLEAGKARGVLYHSFV
mgnify:CR=1 FL=1